MILSFSNGLFLPSEHTKDELFGWGEHIYSKSHLILIYFQPNPTGERGWDPEKECHDRNAIFVVCDEGIEGGGKGATSEKLKVTGAFLIKFAPESTDTPFQQKKKKKVRGTGSEGQVELRK